MTSVAIPESGQPQQADSHVASRVLLLLLVGAEAVWIAGLSYVLIRVLG